VYDAEISGEIRQLLTQTVHSVEQLEILLLLRASPDQVWTVRDVYQRVLTNETSVRRSLEKLCEHGTIRKTGALEFQFNSAADSEGVLEELARLYKEKPTRILYALYGS
jgi:DNA-binding IclR family transcriptional regulator